MKQEEFPSNWLDSPLPQSSPPLWSPEPAEFSGDEDEDEKGNVCTGQLVEWTAGLVWDTYAYGNHDDDSVGWTPTGFSGSTHGVQEISED